MHARSLVPGRLSRGTVMKRSVCLALVLSFIRVAHAQEKPPPNADSLRAIWNDASRPDTVRFAAMNSLMRAVFFTITPDSLVHFADTLYAFAEKRGMKKRMGWALTARGNGFFLQGDFEHANEDYARSLHLFEEMGDPQSQVAPLNGLSNASGTMGDLAHAIEYLTRALRIAEELKDSSAMVRTLGNIGANHNLQGDHATAIRYYERQIEVARAIGDKQVLSEAWNNMASARSEQGDDIGALADYEKSLKLAGEIGYDGLVMTSLMNIGSIRSTQGDHERAMDLFERSLAIAETMGDSGSIGRIHMEMGRSYRDRDLWPQASTQTELALRIAQSTGDVGSIRDAAHLAYQVLKARGDNGEALAMHELYITMRDSVVNDENKQAVMQQKFQYDYDKKEALLQAEQDRKDAVAAEELRRQKLVRNGFVFGFALMVAFAGVFFFQRNRIAHEKERSEELLLNILPEEVAEELKAKGAADAKLIDHVTVLFTDFKGFTTMSEKLSPKELVADIHECFSAFDHIMEKHGIEKIKTIGDAYMAAGGLPTPNSTHALDVVKAAFEIRDFIAEGKARKVAVGLPYFEIRIGIHTGPVVAGIVGVKKFAYDIWGDTVNTASRMETSGEVGQVNISESTFAWVKDVPGLAFTPRGKVQAKGKGEMDMYYVQAS